MHTISNLITLKQLPEISLYPTKSIVSSADPTLCEGKGSGDFGLKAWSFGRPAEKFPCANQIAALSQSYDSLTTGM